MQPAENEESGQYVLVAWNVKCYDGRKSLQPVDRGAKSTTQDVLNNVIKGYPGITMKLDRIEFNRLFKPFVHRWERSMEARDKEQDMTVESHVDLL